MTTHSNILAWEIQWTEETGGTTVHRIAEESDMAQRLDKNNSVLLLYLSWVLNHVCVRDFLLVKFFCGWLAY